MTEKIEEFKKSCMDENPNIVVQRYLLEGSSYFFEEHIMDKKAEFHFKKDVSEALDIHIRDIAIVGSGKLGFSIKPDKDNASLYLFKIFDSDIKTDSEANPSDLDIAIVNNGLFEKQLINIYNHTEAYKTNFNSRKNFAFYILKGWLRPDFTPSDYTISPQINTIQEKYKAIYGRDVNIGIYKSWYYFENYHKNNIYNIYLNLIASS